MKQILKRTIVLLLVLALLPVCHAVAGANGENPVFEVHIAGREEVYPEGSSIPVLSGGTVLLWFTLEDSDLTAPVCGWIGPDLTDAGFTLAYDPVEADDNFCASITAPAELGVGTKANLTVNWYDASELFGTYGGRWSDAPIHYSFEVPIEVVSVLPWEMAFSDSEDAVMEGSYVFVRPGTAAEAILAQCDGAATLQGTNGSQPTADANVASGMVLTLSNGEAKTVIVKGDNTGDGRVTAEDARYALRVAVELEMPNQWQLNASLVAESSKETVTAADARAILRAAVDLEPLPLI